MPSEDRRIIFNSEEIYKALYALSAQKQIAKPPPGIITSIREDEEDNSIIYVAFENHQDKTNKDVEYTRDFLAAALMLFCRGLGIPLPKNAQKSVLIREGKAMLRAQLSR